MARSGYRKQRAAEANRRYALMLDEAGPLTASAQAPRDPVEVARAAGATHRDGQIPGRFYQRLGPNYWKAAFYRDDIRAMTPWLYCGSSRPAGAVELEANDEH